MLVLIPTPSLETGHAGPTRGGRVRFEHTPLGGRVFRSVGILETACETLTPVRRRASSHGPCKCRNNVLSVEMLANACEVLAQRNVALELTNYRIGTWTRSTIIKQNAEDNWSP